MSRRRFVALVAAGTAALSTGSTPTRTNKASAPSAKPAEATPSAQQKEFERQKASTLATVKTIRAYALPPGGDLPVVFKPMRTPKKGR
jgi:hypothetical protein